MTEQNNNNDNFFDSAKKNEEHIKTEQIASLQGKIEALKDKGREDWFFFIFITVILLDILFFYNMDGFAAFSIVVLEILFLAFLAKRMGLEEISILITGLLERLANNRE